MKAPVSVPNHGSEKTATGKFIVEDPTCSGNGNCTGAKCSCKAGWTGNLCELKIRECPKDVPVMANVITPLEPANAMLTSPVKPVITSLPNEMS